MSTNKPTYYYHHLTDDGATSRLQAGSVGVLPTDTIYGLVAVADQPAAVTRLYELKHREHKPGTVIAANIEQLIELGIPRRYLTAVADYWPNPLSIVLPVDNSLAYLTQDQPTLAVRIPADAALRLFLLKTGPLLTSSANQPGEPPATTVAEAEAYFAEAVDFYVDGGSLANHEPSTVIRVVDDAIEVLRPGAIKLDEDGRIIQ